MGLRGRTPAATACDRENSLAPERSQQLKNGDMIKNLFCCVTAFAVLASVVATATEPVGIEVRKRNAIGRLGVVNVQPAVKMEADGTMVVSFHAKEEGTYILVYTSGPKKGKTATSLNVTRPGPVTARIKN